MKIDINIILNHAKIKYIKIILILIFKKCQFTISCIFHCLIFALNTIISCSFITQWIDRSFVRTFYQLIEPHSTQRFWLSSDFTVCTYYKIADVSHRAVIAAHTMWNVKLADSGRPSCHIDVQREPEQE